MTEPFCGNYNRDWVEWDQDTPHKRPCTSWSVVSQQRRRWVVPHAKATDRKYLKPINCIDRHFAPLPDARWQFQVRQYVQRCQQEKLQCPRCCDRALLMLRCGSTTVPYVHRYCVRCSLTSCGLQFQVDSTSTSSRIWSKFCDLESVIGVKTRIYVWLDFLFRIAPYLHRSSFVFDNFSSKYRLWPFGLDCHNRGPYYWCLSVVWLVKGGGVFLEARGG